MVGDGPDRGRVAAGGSAESGGVAGSDQEAGDLAVASERGAVAVAVNGAGHSPGHVGVTLACPVSCLGLRTVGDLVRLLEEAGRVAGLPDDERPAGLDGHRHPRGVVSLDCPLACLYLPVRTVNRLRSPEADCRTVRDLLRLMHSDRLRDVRGIGVRTREEIRRALLRARIDPDHWQETDRT